MICMGTHQEASEHVVLEIHQKGSFFELNKRDLEHMLSEEVHHKGCVLRRESATFNGGQAVFIYDIIPRDSYNKILLQE